MKQAEGLSPSDWQIRDLYGQGLEATGRIDLAITRFQQALTLDPKQSQIELELGLALEKKSDWVGALKYDRKAALSEANGNSRHLPGETFLFSTDAQMEYKAAQLRFADYCATLKADGKTAEASDLEQRVGMLDTNTETLEKVQAALQAGD